MPIAAAIIGAAVIGGVADVASSSSAANAASTASRGAPLVAAETLSRVSHSASMLARSVSSPMLFRASTCPENPLSGLSGDAAGPWPAPSGLSIRWRPAITCTPAKHPR